MKAYKTLNKLFYGPPEVYRKTYEARFSSPTAIHLDFSVAGSPAFFVQNNAIIQQVYHILRLDKEICQLKQQLPPIALSQYTRRCLIDEVVLTNQIEGIRSSRKEIGAVLDELGTQSAQRGKKKRFDGIVKKYAMLQNQEALFLEACQDVRSLYDELVLDEVVAEDPKHRPDGKWFRKDLTEIKNGVGRVIHRGLYPEEAIIASMEKALAFLRDASVEGLYRICLFHYLLEYIHPFYDGNGRLGRFIVSEYLARTMDLLLGYRLSRTIKENLSQYYKAFEICNHTRNLGDLTPFLHMMLGMIAQSEEDLQESLSDKVALLYRYKERIPALPRAKEKDMAALYFLLIQAGLFGEAGTSTREIQAYLSAGYGKVKGLLAKIPEDLLLCQKIGREKFYALQVDRLEAPEYGPYGVDRLTSNGSGPSIDGKPAEPLLPEPDTGKR